MLCVAVPKVLRKGEIHEYDIPVQPLDTLVPVHKYDQLPSYFIYAGLVFVPLTQPYLHEYGDDWMQSSPRRLVDKALNSLMQKPGQQIIVLSQVGCGIWRGVTLENGLHWDPAFCLHCIYTLGHQEAVTVFSHVSTIMSQC